MKAMKRIGALAMVLALVLALGVTALAADLGELNDGSNTTNVDSFTINVILNKDANVNSPANTVTFTLAPAADTDVANPYKVGPTGGIYFGTGDDTATFPVNPETAQCTQTITVTTDNTKFTAPGVYRYKITETTPLNKADLGFATADKTEKYIDVYVKSDGGTGYIVYGATMGDSYDDTTKALADKDSDFNISYTTDDGGTPIVPGDDTPKSYDVTVSKVITGGAADPDESFDFTLTVKGLAAAAGVDVTVEKSGATGADTLTLAADDADYTYTMKGGDSFTLKGLPKTLALEVLETVSGLDGYDTDITFANMNSTSSSGRTASGTVKGDNNNPVGTITFTNTRTTISPTGVVMFVAPLVILLAASFVFYAMSRKSRKNKA